jgi:hypothetical protein
MIRYEVGCILVGIYETVVLFHRFCIPVVVLCLRTNFTADLKLYGDVI